MPVTTAGDRALLMVSSGSSRAAVVAVAVSGVARPPPLAVTVFRIAPYTPGAANSVTRA